MNTPSHFLMTAALEKKLHRVPIVKSAFLWGSVAPDLPLWLLSIGGMVYYHLMLGWSLRETFHLMYDQLYFHHPFWIACHNFLHSPLILGVGLAIVWRSRQQSGSRSRWLFWFLLASLFHTGVDILTHVDDGPLLLFPIDWSLRFRSAVSYYDPRYFGRSFQQFELGLDLFCLLYLLIPKRRARQQ